MMIVLGITGGSGCGKTAVCEHLMDLGIDVIDTDKVARMIVSPKMPALFEIEDEFGSAYLNEDGTLNRKKLGELVFSDPDKLLALNKITHKYITQYVLEYIKNCENDMVAIDGAVLLESEIATICDYIIFTEIIVELKSHYYEEDLHYIIATFCYNSKSLCSERSFRNEF